jgi:sodium-dependent dicarboxylate transporter 2/3/5
MTDDAFSGRQLHQKIGLVAGPLAALIIYFIFKPEGISPEGTKVAAIVAWMAIWWATEATHVAVTAFLPLVLFPTLGIGKMSVTASSYSHPIIYLFLGGFIMAIALERSRLHLRAALSVFQMAGVEARSLVGGLMIATALISMWVSNTSTTLMMLPIAMSVVHVVRETMDDLKPKEINNFEICMFLGLAYGATLGGVATLVGTPPNVFMAGFMESTYGVEVDFARWMIIGVPLMVIMLPITWFALTRFLYPINFTASERTITHIAIRKKELGPLSTFEKRTGLLFLLLVSAWILRKPLVSLTGAAELSDAVLAMIAAIAAFLIPSGQKNGEALMTWEDTRKLPWGVLILFGGGLALAAGMTSSELTLWIGKQLAPLGTINIAILVVAACALVIFLTELTSNTATTATFLPVMAGIAIEMGQDPLIFVIPVTLAASFAFMLPVATPPNAIVFSSGRVSIPQMMRAGFALNLISVVVLTIVAVFLVPRVFG